jgi:hypothetical protein
MGIAKTFITKFEPCILLLHELLIATKHKSNTCVVLPTSKAQDLKEKLLAVMV